MVTTNETIGGTDICPLFPTLVGCIFIHKPTKFDRSAYLVQRLQGCDKQKNNLLTPFDPLICLTLIAFWSPSNPHLEKGKSDGYDVWLRGQEGAEVFRQIYSPVQTVYTPHTGSRHGFSHNDCNNRSLFQNFPFFVPKDHLWMAPKLKLAPATLLHKKLYTENAKSRYPTYIFTCRLVLKNTTGTVTKNTNNENSIAPASRHTRLAYTYYADRV